MSARNDARVMLLLSLLCFSISTAIAMEPLYSFDSARDASRFQTWTENVRCVVCQGQSIAESSAPIAMDLKQKIADLIRHHESDEAIRVYLVTRYGERILNDPGFSKRAISLWVFPGVAMMVGLYVLFRQKKAKAR